MLKFTLEEKIRYKLNGFGQKNKFCGLSARCLSALNKGFFGMLRFFPANAKRLSMVVLTFFLFAAYSSFSFPMFAQSAAHDNGIEIDEESEGISFAEEKEFSVEELAQLGALKDAKTPDGNFLTEESEDSEDYEIGDEVYGLEEILKNSGIDLTKEKEEDPAENSGVNEDIETGSYSFSPDDWRLILVNKTHYIPENYTFPLGTISGSLKCDERVLEDLLRMFQAAKDDGVSLLVASPYRTHDRQTNNFNRSINNYLNRGMSYMEAYKLTSLAITIPDTSEHQIGLAIDIWTDSFKKLTEGFGDTKAGQWLAKNSYKYGFILRYPQGKEEITGIEYEPWHFRYVGLEAAKVMYEEEITLEEFWEIYLK